MKHYRTIVLLSCLLSVLGASADLVMSTMTLRNTVGGVTSSITAKMQVDDGSRVVILGNGQTACISQYTEGTLIIPGTFKINGDDYIVRVGQLAFRFCNSITEVIMEEGVQSIGDFAFVGCSSLKRVEMPVTMDVIGSGAFAGLTALTEVVSHATVAPLWLYDDVFAFEGTVEATSRLANQRTLYVPRFCSDSYQRTKYRKTVGWIDAFGIIKEAENPHQVIEISTIDDLADLSSEVNSGNNMGDFTVRLTADLIFHGADGTRANWHSWIPIGTAEHPFRGVFDGGGHIIKNVKNGNGATISDTNVGLFGYTESASIGNLILENVSMHGVDNVGTLVGTACNSLIHDVLVFDATSTSKSYNCAQASNGCAGGLVGKAINSNIDDCVFFGNASGTTSVGGIVGSSQSIVRVTDCASASPSLNNPTTQGIIGGLVGEASDSTYVLRCYSRSILEGEQSTRIRGGIVGKYPPSETIEAVVIDNCAYLNSTDYMPETNYDINDNVKHHGYCQDFDNVSDMEDDGLMNVLGGEQWYYFHDDVNGCPIPKSLVEGYMRWAGLKDSDGFVYMGVGTPIESYTIIGYEGSKTDITLPSVHDQWNVTAIADHAFKGLALTSVVIPEGIMTIEEKAFANCKELTSLTIGKDVSSEYNGWLDGCVSLSNISVQAGNTVYSVTDGNLYDQNGQRLIRCATGCTGQDGTLTLPSSVTAIVPGAFAGCDNLAVVDLRQTSTAWRFDRQTDASPFFNASRYTLFILNDNATATAQEPNVIYKDGANYECDELQLTDRMGLNSPVTFAAASTYYDRPFAPSMRLAPSESEGDDAGYEYVPVGYTFCLPFKPNIAYGKGLKVYDYREVATDETGTVVTFTELGNDQFFYTGIVPMHPYYLVCESGGPFKFSTKASTPISSNVTSGTSGSHKDYIFEGTTVAIPNSELYDAAQAKYILQSDGNWHKIPQNQPKAFVGAFRSYFKATDSSSSVKALTTILEDEADAIGRVVIRTIDADGTTGYYDLQGRRLSGKPHQGLFIHDGRVQGNSGAQ